MTDPNPTTRMPLPNDPAAPGGTADPGSAPGFAAIQPPSQHGAPPAAPPQPAGWPPPTWVRGSRRSRDGRLGSVIFGLIVLGIGLWFFAERTLGLDLPKISWSQGWPVILIVIGAGIAVASMRDRGG